MAYRSKIPTTSAIDDRLQGTCICMLCGVSYRLHHEKQQVLRIARTGFDKYSCVPTVLRTLVDVAIALGIS